MSSYPDKLKGGAAMNIGARVRLKSGGPLMTINEIEDDGTVTCVWFDASGKLQYANFKPEVLMITTAE